MNQTMDYSMDHSVAEGTNAVERYLLEETTLEERAAFEEHLFDCPICAEEVRNGATFIDNVKVVLKEERVERKKLWSLLGWFQPPMLVPNFAAIALAAVVIFQNTVTLPALRSPQILTSDVIAPLAREGGSVILVDHKKAMFNMNFSVDAPRVYADYVCTFESVSGKKIVEISTAQQKFSSFTLGVLLPSAKFPAGNYSMTVRPTSETGTPIGRYTFTVRDGA